MKNTRLGLILIGATVLLLVPFIAMQFSNEVVWTSSDFVLMGILLFGTGLSIETILRKVKTVKTGYCSPQPFWRSSFSYGPRWPWACLEVR